MNLKILLQKITEHYNNQKPFVLYSHPESDTVEVLLQKNSKKYTSEAFDKRGIVMAPFKSGGVPICIPLEESEYISHEFSKENIQTETVDPSFKILEKESYMRLVSKALTAINHKNTHKVVVSRKKEFPISNTDFSSFIPRLLHLYPTAFRYVWYHPETGLWCGASPEVLLVTNGESFTTMALAGTKRIEGKESPQWTQKEKNEQQVTAFKRLLRFYAFQKHIPTRQVHSHIYAQILPGCLKIKKLRWPLLQLRCTQHLRYVVRPYRQHSNL